MFNYDLGTIADLDRVQTIEKETEIAPQDRNSVRKPHKKVVSAELPQGEKANQLELAIQPEATMLEINSVTETSIVYNKD